MARRYLNNEQIDRRHIYIARIDPDLCNMCDVCRRVCIYDAPYRTQKTYVISDACDGCGLCVKLCPVKAISLVPRGNEP